MKDVLSLACLHSRLDLTLTDHFTVCYARTDFLYLALHLLGLLTLLWSSSSKALTADL